MPAALLLLLISACGDASTDLSSLLLPSIGGYDVSTSASGPLNIDAAASSLPTGRDQTGVALAATGFADGSTRVFTATTPDRYDYVIDAVYKFRTASGAQRFLDTVHDLLRQAGTVVLFTEPTLPHSVAFLMSGPTKQGGRSVFCDGVLDRHDVDVYAITDCSTTPVSAGHAIALAQRQAGVTPTPG